MRARPITSKVTLMIRRVLGRQIAVFAHLDDDASQSAMACGVGRHGYALRG
jgi:hypothetical protein